jgi:UPF0176 protein
MVEPKILLFYIFTPLGDPDAVRLWQTSLCESLGLKGRIIISSHGLNGTVGGPLTAVKKYVRKTREFAPFKSIDFKWSEGTGHDFPRLTVKVRDEIVSFGVADEIVVNEDGIVGGGVHLSPSEVHELVEQRGDEVVFFDGRNAYEAAIGKFKNAVIPNVATTPDFVAELESGKYDHLKDKPIVTYCTGGIRCEVLSMVLKNRGFEEVYQLDGGIVRYGEQFRDKGLWEGSLYVFDNRMNVEFSDEAKILGACQSCSHPTHRYYNCTNLECRRLTLACEHCSADATTVQCPECSTL